MPACTEFRFSAWRFSSGSAPPAQGHGVGKVPLRQLLASLLQLPQGQHLPDSRPQQHQVQRHIQRRLPPVHAIGEDQQVRRHNGQQHRRRFPRQRQAQKQPPQVPPGPHGPPAEKPQQPQRQQVAEHGPGLAPGRKRQHEQIRQRHKYRQAQRGRWIVHGVQIDVPHAGQPQHKQVHRNLLHPGQMDALMARPVSRRRQGEHQGCRSRHGAHRRHGPQHIQAPVRMHVIDIYVYQLDSAIHRRRARQQGQQKGQGLGPWLFQQLFHCAAPSILYPLPHTTFRYRGSAGLISIFSRMCRTWTATGLSAAGSSCHTRR